MAMSSHCEELVGILSWCENSYLGHCGLRFSWNHLPVLETNSSEVTSSCLLHKSRQIISGQDSLSVEGPPPLADRSSSWSIQRRGTPAGPSRGGTLAGPSREGVPQLVLPGGYPGLSPKPFQQSFTAGPSTGGGGDRSWSIKGGGYPSWSIQRGEGGGTLAGPSRGGRSAS